MFLIITEPMAKAQREQRRYGRGAAQLWPAMNEVPN